MHRQTICLCGFGTMPAFACPINRCDFTTCDVKAAITAALLTIHNKEHVKTPQAASKQKASKIQRPTI